MGNGQRRNALQVSRLEIHSGQNISVIVDRVGRRYSLREGKPNRRQKSEQNSDSFHESQSKHFPAMPLC
jgi:hypothetical protein